MDDNINDTINDTINDKLNKLDKTTLFFLTNKSYINKINKNIQTEIDDDIKNDFIKYKKHKKNIINKLFEEYTNTDTKSKSKSKINDNIVSENKYNNAFYIFSKLCIQHIKSEELNKRITSDLSNFSNFSNFNDNSNNDNSNIDNSNIDNSNIDNSNIDNSNIDNSHILINNDKILFTANNNNNNNNIKKFIDIKTTSSKKKILPRRIE